MLVVGGDVYMGWIVGIDVLCGVGGFFFGYYYWLFWEVMMYVVDVVLIFVVEVDDF